jgi:hypothetical protein
MKNKGLKIYFYVDFKNFLTKFSYYYNYLLNYHRINVIISKIV